MFREKKRAPATGDLLQNSLLYQHFHAQLEEIHKHKWYESEKAGHDIGFERALTEWSIKHRPQWLKNRRRAARAIPFFPLPAAARTELRA